MIKRSQHIDIAKGIGILLVVFGHSVFVMQDKEELFRIIFSFHIPLFLFISGVFFHPSAPFGDFFRHKTDALLKPFLMLFVVIGVIVYAYLDYPMVVYALKILYFSGTTLASVWVPLWFLPHLWLVCIMAWTIFNIGSLEKRRWWSQFVIALLLLVVGVYLMQNAQFAMAMATPLLETDKKEMVLRGLPFSADFLFVSLFFFMLGHITSKHVLQGHPSLVLSVLSLALFVGLHVVYDSTIDLNYRVYDSVWVSTLQALAGIYLVLTVSSVMQRFNFGAAILAYIGSGSLFVMMLHNYFQVRTLSSLTGIYPESATLNAILAFIVGVVAPLVFWEVIRRIPILSIFWLPARGNSLFAGRALSRQTTHHSLGGARHSF